MKYYLPTNKILSHTMNQQEYYPFHYVKPYYIKKWLIEHGADKN